MKKALVRPRVGGDLRRGLTLVELLVVICIIGLLAAMLMPAVQQVRETARAATCRNRLRSLALATLQFEQSAGCFPPARLLPVADGTAAGSPSATWLIRVMPFIEQSVAAAAWDEAKPYADQSIAARSLVVPDYLCPSRRDSSNAVTASVMSPRRMAACGCLIPGRLVSGGAVADFGGNHGHLVPAAASAAAGAGLIVSADSLPGTSRWHPRVRSKDVIDGLTHTLLAGEMHVPRSGLCVPPDNGPAYDATDFFNFSRIGGPGVPLGDGPDDDVAGMGLFAFGSWHPGSCHFALGDGRIETLSTTISSDVLSSLCNRADDPR